MVEVNSQQLPTLTWKPFPTPVCGEKVKSRWEGELEENRQNLVQKFSAMIAPAMFYSLTGFSKGAVAETGADQLRDGFSEILDVLTAVAEPVLWFYALIGCIMIATGKSKDSGWEKLKQVGYAYLGISLLPAFFALLRWLSNLIQGSISF